MKENYRFRTSLGYVYLSFDEEDFKVYTWEWSADTDRNNPIILSKIRIHISKIEIKSGEEFLEKLYKGKLVEVVKKEDGSFWAIIYLYDKYYGSPEYLIEKCDKKEPNKLTEQTFKDTDKGINLHSAESVEELIKDLNN